MAGKYSARPASARDSARERILDAAYDLFSRYGIRAVGIDRVVAEAGVAKMTLYHHFPSKERLVLAFLDLRGERWTRAWLESEMQARASTPTGQALALFDALDDWFHEADFEGCALVRTVYETPTPGDPVHRAAVARLLDVRALIEDRVGRAGVAEPARLATELHLLVLGALASRSAGMLDAARAAQRQAQRLIESAAS